MVAVAGMAVLFGAYRGLAELFLWGGYALRERNYLKMVRSVESRIGTPTERPGDLCLLSKCRQDALYSEPEPEPEHDL